MATNRNGKEGPRLQTRKDQIKAVEAHLFQYNHYRVAIKNIEGQLDYLMPSTTASYEAMEGTRGAFVIYSSVERAVHDRLESKHAMDLHEQKKRYELIISCIDAALATLSEEERAFVQRRYFDQISVVKIAEERNKAASIMYQLRDRVLEKLLISLGAIEKF